jgi:hypothetical protein
MTSLLPLPPDPMPLREALRGLRHVLRRGGESLRETVPVGSLPGPAADVAGKVLHHVGQVARKVDSVASDIAGRMLGVADAPPAPDLAGPVDAGGFAAAVYAALRVVLARMGVADAFVSEVAARDAPGAAYADPVDADEAARAAGLMLALLAGQVVRDVVPGAQSDIAPVAVPPVAVFAVMLWLVADRSQDGGEAALQAAADLALAMAPDVAAAAGARDAGRIAALLAEFRPHV